MKVQNNHWGEKNIWNFSDFLKAKFRRICPYGRKYLEKIVAECMRDVFLLVVLAAVIIVLWNSMFEVCSVLYVIESLFLVIYLIGTEVPNFILQKQENKVYQELLIYFSRVKHRYMACRHVANAVLNAAEHMSYEVQCLASEMYRVLMESERKEKIREYISYHHTNLFLKLFLIQAYETSEKGNDFFAENVEQIRLELMEEIYRRKQRTHEFAGYTFVAITPFFMMPVLRQWGLEFAPELEFFYAGTGVLLETVTFYVTIIIYRLINRAKEITLFSEMTGEKVWNIEGLYRSRIISLITCRMEQAKGKVSYAIRKLIHTSGERISFGRFCLRIFIAAIGTFFVIALFFSVIHQRERELVLECVEAIDTIAPVANEEKKLILSEHILAVTEQCIERKGVTEEEIYALLREKVRLGNESLEMAAVEEIKNKLKQYEKAQGTFGEFILCLLGSFGAGLLPLLRLKFQEKAVCAGAVHEVRQFQSVILMERRLHGITIVGLLEDLEVFSLRFKDVLRKCINSYGAGPEKALQRLKEEGCKLHKGFEELADAFLSVDEVGVELAFAEVENNRRLLEKMTQLETEIRTERKKDNTEFIAKVPMVLAVGIYFILPFFIYSLQGVYEVFELLEGMQL